MLPTIATNVHENYETFLQKRSELNSLVERQLSLLSTLDMAEWEETLHSLKERISTDTFKILVIGEFKRGKSTFINALLGQEILPAHATPCTGIINSIQWGDSPKAFLHLHAQDSLERQPKEISINDIEEYVEIKTEIDENYINPAEEVKIFWPLELCRKGVEIIDSPGLNEHNIREKIAMDYLPIVDAVIFVLSCEALASKTELRVIENNLRAIGHEDIFFICNRFDLIKNKEKERVKRFGKSKLLPLTKRGEKGVFFLSASEALEGRIEGDEQKVIESGLPILERELENFLTTDRGRLKILEPTKYIWQSINEARRIIPEREAMLRTDSQVIEQRYHAAQIPLKQLELKRKQIGIRISHFCDDLKLQIKDQAYTFYESIAEKIALWVEEYQLECNIDIFQGKMFVNEAEMQVQVKQIVYELASHLALQIENEFIPWQARELQPLLTSRLHDLKLDIDARANEFIRLVDDIRSQLVSGKQSSISTTRKASDLERLFSAAGNPITGSPGWTRVILGLTPWSGFTTIGVKIMGAALASLVVIGLCSWVVIPAVIVVLASLAEDEFKKVNQQIEQKIKKVITLKFTEQLRKSAKEQAEKFAEDILSKFSDIQVTVDRGLGKEIHSIRNQVDSILKEKQKGQAYVEQRIDELAVVSQDLEDLERELNILIAQIGRLQVQQDLTRDRRVA
ncbi:GTP-binding protein [Chroococcidiopsis sp. CCALA 051]|uniref:dynamin family protein n=1 Tax=Chroococcidiopsis sp. CCALA 051 TaxID=869949 RepID=UPI000D0DB6C7|nr:dynamin family protein [Chroococcidiopsis sp. CCALA 051]PSM49881.1 GTP-binding protein [Chroococcidiopsis sp. CCALA 051]